MGGGAGRVGGGLGLSVLRVKAVAAEDQDHEVNLHVDGQMVLEGRETLSRKPLTGEDIRDRMWCLLAHNDDSQ